MFSPGGEYSTNFIQEGSAPFYTPFSYSTQPLALFDNLPEFVMPHTSGGYLLKGRQTFVQIVDIGIWVHSIRVAHVVRLRIYKD